MYFQQKEHQPPHIHVAYAEYSASLTIEDGEVLEGDLPKKARMLVNEWMELHREQLRKIWETQEFVSIPGLE